jgi:hypothetical protein
VDGEPVATQMLAPALVGVPVGAGEHAVVLRYESYPWYLPLFLAGIIAVAALRLYRSSRRGRPDTPSSVGRYSFKPSPKR